MIFSLGVSDYVLMKVISVRQCFHEIVTFFVALVLQNEYHVECAHHIVSSLISLRVVILIILDILFVHRFLSPVLPLAKVFHTEDIWVSIFFCEVGLKHVKINNQDLSSSLSLNNTLS